jgi:hypothetical protein
MPLPPGVLELESRAIGINGEPTLRETYLLLRESWLGGARDREIALHLMFLAWYGLVEPAHLTGFTESSDEQTELRAAFNNVHDFFEAQIRTDPELLFTIGLAADMFPYMLGEEAVWENRAIEYRRMYHAIAPDGIDPSVFSGRGAYGEYYQGQAMVKNGF